MCIILTLLGIVLTFYLAKYILEIRNNSDKITITKKDFLLYCIAALYPVLHLYFININEIYFYIFLVFLFIFTILSVLTFFACKLLVKNEERALFLSLGFITFMNAAGLFKDYHLIFALSCLFVLILFLKVNSKVIFKFFRAFSFMLALFLVFEAVFAILPGYNSDNKNAEIQKLYYKDAAPDTDVYIILADMYAGENTLLNSFNYDNSKFYKALQEMGFNVFRNINSNYNKTHLTLGSILNMEYLDDLKFDSFKDAFSRALIFKKALENNYDTFAYVSLEFSVSDKSYLNGYKLYNVSEIYTQAELFMKNTVFEPFTDFCSPAGAIFSVADDVSPVYSILSNINSKADNSQKPRFWFFHLMAPHTPYLAPNNTYGTEDIELSSLTGEHIINKDAYILYLKYTNDEILKAVSKVIKYSKKPPIILIFGDHGPRLHCYIKNEQKYFSKLAKEQDTLNAYYNTFAAVYCPDEMQKKFNGVESLINLFIEFSNAIFNESKPRVKDKFYYSYMDVTATYYPAAMENGFKLKIKDGNFIPLKDF